jgi:Kdo2-lipid IVA lauroyltransferase/acyltransferase
MSANPVVKCDSRDRTTSVGQPLHDAWGLFKRPISHSASFALFRGVGALSFRSKWKLAELLCANSLRRDKNLTEVLSRNLSACFSDSTAEAVRDFAFVNTQETFFALLDRFRIWNLTEAELREAVTLANAQGLYQHMARGPVVLLCPHFLGIEAAFQRLTLETSFTTLYRPSGATAFEALRARARQRFGQQHLYRTDDSLLPMVRRVRAGTPLFLLPDLDCGAAGAVFAPFFGITASTSPLTAWCALRSKATVLPVSVRRGDKDTYEVTIHEPLSTLSADMTEATGQVNAAIEQLVRAHPEHYWWGQPRFATRPAGEPKFYSDDVLAYAKTAFGSAV